MGEFKITFPKGYSDIKNIKLGRCEIHITFDSEEVYFVNVFTIKMIEYLINNKNQKGFIYSDLLIVKDLHKETIKQAVVESVKNFYYKEVYTKQNMIDIFGNIQYEDLIDMNDFPEETFGLPRNISNNYKITFPTGYNNTNIVNDNIDINVVFQTGEVYFGTLVTLDNIKSFLFRGDSYFWMSNMFIVKDLEKDTINQAITDSLLNNDFKFIFHRIGNISEVFSNLSFEELINMNDFAIDN